MLVALSSRFHFDFVAGLNMPHYDFSVLSPYEFECLCRDLLQKKENVYIESFTAGKDGGIDLRFAKVKANALDSTSEIVVVQVKKYKDWQSLLPALRKEADKVRKLKPSRYYLMTSAGLTPGNKDEIKKIFVPYIQSSEDIFGRDDLNNLLGQFQEIEKLHFNLWLSSTNVLETILNKRYSTWTRIKEEEIKDTIKLYVKNDSLTKAVEILKEYHFVLISGIPGIGKTTLANILVDLLLAKGYEFVNLEGDPDAFAALNAEGKKQVFYFDDFLGRNALELNHLKGEGKLLSLIRFIRRSARKLLILTTREYILQDAMKISDGMNIDNLEIAKCILDLGSYTKEIRAKILYKHLANAKLSDEYIDCLLSDRQYMQLIEHQNFNPRIIQTFISGQHWKECKPEEFVATFKKYFDTPLSVWENVFSNRPREEQYALLVLLAMGQPVLLTDWQSACDCFFKKSRPELGLVVDIIEWRKILKSLIGTFIRTDIINGEAVVEFQNPSIFDFLFSFVRDENLIRQLIEGASFIDQLCKLFSDSGSKSKWEVSKNMYSLLNNKIRLILADCKTCGLIRWQGNSFMKEQASVIRGLNLCLDSFPKVNEAFHFAEETTSLDLIKSDQFSCDDKCELLAKLDWNRMPYHADIALDFVEGEITSVYECLKYMQLCDKLQMRGRFEKDSFVSDFQDRLKEETDSYMDLDYAEGLLEDVEHIRNIAPDLVSVDDFDNLESKVCELSAENDALAEQYDEDEWADRLYSKRHSAESIDEMFGSLRQS